MKLHSTKNSVSRADGVDLVDARLIGRRPVEDGGVGGQVDAQERRRRAQAQQRVQPADDEFVAAEDRGDVGHVRRLVGLRRRTVSI